MVAPFPVRRTGNPAGHWRFTNPAKKESFTCIKKKKNYTRCPKNICRFFTYLKPWKRERTFSEARLRRNGSESGPAPTGAPVGAPPSPPSPRARSRGPGAGHRSTLGMAHARTHPAFVEAQVPLRRRAPASRRRRGRRAREGLRPRRLSARDAQLKNRKMKARIGGKPRGPLASSPIRFGLGLALGPCRACRCVLSVRPRRGRGARNWPPAATRRPDKERQTKAILHLGFFICAKRGPRLPSDMKAQNPHTNPYPVLGRGGGPWGRGSSAPRLRGTCCACPPAPPSQRFPHEARSWSRISARGIQRSIRRHLSRLNSIRLLRSFWRTGCRSHFSVKRRLEER